MITLVAFALFINISEVSAASNTVDQTAVIKSTDTVKKYVETKNNVPKTITVGNSKVASSQYLYLLTTTTTKVYTGNKAPVTLKGVSYPTKPSESLRSGNLVKSQYIQIANNVNSYIYKYNRVPNYVSTPLGTTRYENLIYTYSKILSFYNTNHRLPNYVSVTPWKTAEGTLNIKTSNVQSVVDSIGYKEAKYRDIQGQSSASVMEKVGYGDCWADSSWLYNKLSAAGVAVRIMGTSSGGILYLHRWVQINIGNGWQTWNYAKYNSQHYGALGSGIFVVKSSV